MFWYTRKKYVYNGFVAVVNFDLIGYKNMIKWYS